MRVICCIYPHRYESYPTSRAQSVASSFFNNYERAYLATFLNSVGFEATEAAVAQAARLH